MTRARWIAGALLLAGILLAVRKGREPGPPDALALREIKTEPFEVWSVYEGQMESREVTQVASRLDGPATVVELVPDGAPAAPGDVLVRFDAAQWERDVLRLERDYRLASAELLSLRQARLPMELKELDARVAEARRALAVEERALNDDRELCRDHLIAEEEVAQQEMRAEGARLAAASLAEQVSLTREFVHPSLLERAEATRATAEQELELARRQISNGVIRAALAGVVTYKPVAVGGEFRSIRVGDTVYRNQPFLLLSDRSNLVLRCEVPESDLARVRAGADCRLRPLAYPGEVMEGTIETVGGAVRTVTGRRGNQKFVVMTAVPAVPDERLRPGMTVEVRVLSYQAPAAVTVPRAAVEWVDGVATCSVRRGGETRRTALKLGRADETRFEVLDGLVPGDRVWVP